MVCIFLFFFFNFFVNGVKLDWRLSDESPAEDCSEEERDEKYRKSVKCKVFLGFTSNLISSGVRDTVRYLTEHHMVSFALEMAFQKGCDFCDFLCLILEHLSKDKDFIFCVYIL